MAINTITAPRMMSTDAIRVAGAVVAVASTLVMANRRHASTPPAALRYCTCSMPRIVGCSVHL
jgi:hypothetical protein